MSIKIKNVIPVISDVMTPEMIKYICKYLDADTVVDSEKLTVGPMSVENEYDEALAAPGVVELCIKAEKEGCNAIFITPTRSCQTKSGQWLAFLRMRGSPARPRKSVQNSSA